jgi:lactase-phlorizin hydrolase
VDRKSAEEGLPTSRLPTFDADWTYLIKGSYDFLGLNHYTTELAAHGTIEGEPIGWKSDQNVVFSYHEDWPESASAWLKVVPWGFRKLLKWINKTYGNPLVYVTENGFSDEDGLIDSNRTNYYRNYINNLLYAVNVDGCNVKSYTAWSLMDNFEWARGYSERFGVHHVDYTTPARTRTPKQSAQTLTKIFADNGFPDPNPPSVPPSEAPPSVPPSEAPPSVPPSEAPPSVPPQTGGSSVQSRFSGTLLAILPIYLCVKLGFGF